MKIIAPGRIFFLHNAAKGAEQKAPGHSAHIALTPEQKSPLEYSTPQVSIKVTKLNTQYLTLGSTPQEVKSGELPKGARGTIYEKNYIVKRVFRKPER